MRSMTYFCVVEGQQEKMYLNHLARLLTDFPKKVIKFNCVIDNASRLKTEYVEYDKVFLFDHDLDPIRFERNLDTCVSLNRNAGAKRSKRNGTPHIYHAYSNICFDLWLLLHKQDYFRAETATDAYVDHVRSAFNLERNADIKREDVIEHILKQINLDDVKLAISRAERIVGAKCPEDRKYTAASNFYYPNPDFSIHTFIAKVIDDAQ